MTSKNNVETQTLRQQFIIFTITITISIIISGIIILAIIIVIIIMFSIVCLLTADASNNRCVHVQKPHPT